jgi:hypothetical protein
MLSRRAHNPCDERAANMSRRRERRLVKALTPRLNSRCAVGVRNAPTMVASDAANSNHRKSSSASAVVPASTLRSTRFARRGAWNEFAVRDIRTSALKRENASVMRRVRTPAMRAEYASVPIRLIAKVSAKSVVSCASIGLRIGIAIGRPSNGRVQRRADTTADKRPHGCASAATIVMCLY